jgi:D-alanyl-lipoteichoic acid acyltransferase DltB (MBOAT superfamily)
MQIFYYSMNMWLFLRLTTLLWEFGSGRIDPPGIFAYATWVALPFTLIGPVLRYSQFSAPAVTDRATADRAPGAPASPMWPRLVIATLQFLLGIFLTSVLSLANSNVGLPRWERIAISFSVAPWSFYLLWAGYFKYMEVLARAWGIELPPSFNLPFGRRNLSEFWANWNMTATSVIRDYFFYNRWGLAKVNLYLNALIVFLMVGVWHGLNGYWVLWGLLHGVGFCAFLWYKANKTRFTLWQPHPSWPRAVAGRVATYLYVCSCWFLPPTILKLFR